MKFQRTPGVIDGSPYATYRQQTRKDFRKFCAYCFRHEAEAGGEAQYVQDHFEPQSKNPARARVFLNLYWCCGECNSGKNKGSEWPSADEIARGEVFCDPVHHDPELVDYDRSPAGGYIPKTPAGRYTIDTLNLDSRQTIRDTWAQRNKEKTLGSHYVAMLERAIAAAISTGAAEEPVVRRVIDQVEPILDALRIWLRSDPFVSASMPEIVPEPLLNLLLLPRRKKA